MPGDAVTGPGVTAATPRRRRRRRTPRARVGTTSTRPCAAERDHLSITELPDPLLDTDATVVRTALVNVSLAAGCGPTRYVVAMAIGTALHASVLGSLASPIFLSCTGGALLASFSEPRRTPPRAPWPELHISVETVGPQVSAATRKRQLSTRHQMTCWATAMRID